MATLRKNFNAAVDLSAHQHKFVSFDASGDLVKSGAGAVPQFITTDKQDVVGAAVGLAQYGEPALLQVDGSGTAIVPGDRLKPDASGRGVKVTAFAGQEYGALATEASTAADDIISVISVPPTDTGA